MDLDSAHVLITGASRGIGSAMATEFRRRGSRVSLAARSVEPLERLARELGGRAFPVDLASEEATDSLIARVERVAGPIDVLVNNAGLETNSAFHTTDPSQIRAVSRLNLEVPMILTRGVLLGMLERRSGHLLFVSSLAGTGGFPGLAPYAATKAGLTNFAATLAMELKDTSVGTTVIAPGPVDTRMWGTIEKTDELADMLVRLRRLHLLPTMEPAELARLAVAATAADRAYVGRPRRLAVNHALRNLPTRITSAALAGVRLGPQE